MLWLESSGAHHRRRPPLIAAAVLLATLTTTARPAAAVGSAQVFLATPGLPVSFGDDIQSDGGAFIFRALLFATLLYLSGYGDPSICYALEVTNPLEDDEDVNGNPTGNVFFNVDMPIAPLDSNTVRAKLTIELADTNDDGIAYLKHRAGFSEFQRAFLVNGPSGTPLGVALGVADITEPGVYEFETGTTSPISGPTTPPNESAITSLITTFILSPGDTVLLRGQIVQDDGSGAPVCEIPGQPSITGCSYPTAIIGTSDKDVLNGTADDDVLCGGDGNDRINGKGGNDRIYGGAGKDSISGGAGRDLIFGEEGDDLICGDFFAGPPARTVGSDAAACVGDGSAASFDDRINGGDGKDFIGGGPGPDVIRGGPGNDRIAGGPGRDRLIGEDGDDRLAGGDGRDLLRGDAGADELYGEPGMDELLADDGAADTVVNGGAGNDVATIDAGLDPTIGVETIAP